ncbi:MAG: cation transporter, partial [Chthoniobacterales bacterium]|nr:cation transporter [Chthoniobacterales bacterium]
MALDIKRQLAHVPRAEAIAVTMSVVVSIVLLVIKFVAYYFTGSAAIFSDALESIVNVIASIVAAYSLFLAHQPADESHPYGHGKAEFLSAGFEGGMILLAAMVIAFHAVEQILRGPSVEELDIGMILIFFAGAINGIVGLIVIRTGKSRSSATLAADGKHLLTDAITSAGVLVALLIVRFTGAAWVDPLAALLVAAYIIVMGIGLLRESTAGLMDAQDQADERLLRDILDGHVGAKTAEGKLPREPRICGYHKVRHRHSGRYHWVDFHIKVPAWWDVNRGHQVASAIEHEIEQSLVEGDATAHVEPCADATCVTCAENAVIRRGSPNDEIRNP